MGTVGTRVTRAMSRKHHAKDETNGNVSDLGSSSRFPNCEAQKRGVRIGSVAKLELSWGAVGGDRAKP